MRRWIAPVAFVFGIAVGVLGMRSQMRTFPNGLWAWRWNRIEYFPPPPTLIAVQDLPVGTVLRDDLLSVRGIPDGLISDGLAPDQLASIRGLTLTVPLLAGDPVRRVSLAKGGTVETACSELVQAVNAKQPDVARERLEAVRAFVSR